MATLAESFLADLDDLSDASDREDEVPQEDENNQMAEDGNAELDFENLQAVARLAGSDRYGSIMSQVRTSLEAGPAAAMDVDGGASAGPAGPSEEDPMYRLLVDCNQLAVDIDNELLVVHNYIRDRYRLRFPELDSLVQHPIDYARVAKAIGNEIDITNVDLDAVLPQATIMVVSVTASTTSGRPLEPEKLDRVLQACDLALQLDADKALILRLVQEQMHRISPNLSTAVGTEIAAKLMGVAGGLRALSQMPACNLQVLGAKRKTLAGFSTASTNPHQGFIFSCDVVQKTPPALRQKSVRLVSNTCSRLARVDAYGQDPAGSMGQQCLDEMRKKIEKWQEPPPAKQTKVLPVPDMEPRKRRGGRRHRKMKERFGLTDIHKSANRMNFNVAEEEFIDGEDTIGLGTLGAKGGSGRIRAAAQQQRQKLNARQAKKFKTRMVGSSGPTSGLSSTLAFTPVQGIELEDPSARAAPSLDKRDGTESYFSEYSGFRSIKNRP